MRVFLLVAAIVLMVTACGDVGNAVSSQAYPPSISVTGVGTATGVADMVSINFNVDVSDIDAGVAVSEATELAEGAIAAAIEAGVEETDIETVGYSLYMEEEYDYNTYEYTGENIYHLTHSFTVEVNTIEQVGDVISALVSGGATSIGGIYFTVSNREELITEAREMALIEAKITAEQLAEGVNVSLGDPINVSEWVDYYGGYDSYGYGWSDDEYYYDSPPISPGNSSITVNVSVSFAID